MGVHPLEPVAGIGDDPGPLPGTDFPLAVATDRRHPVHTHDNQTDGNGNNSGTTQNLDHFTPFVCDMCSLGAARFVRTSSGVLQLSTRCEPCEGQEVPVEGVDAAAPMF